MSRYDFSGIRPGTRVSIGWDRPLRTFFVQVMKSTLPEDVVDDAAEEDREENTIVWLGTHQGELPYAAEAIRIARSHAVLPGDICATLETDRLRRSGDINGSAQLTA